MTGPEHYRRAEALLVSCQVGTDTDDEGRTVEAYPGSAMHKLDELDDDPVQIANCLRAALVHATLAQTAAMMTVDAPDTPSVVTDDWEAVLS